MYCVCIPLKLMYIGVHVYTIVTCKSAQERVTGVRACSYVKIETGRNFPPVLKIVTRTA